MLSVHHFYTKTHLQSKYQFLWVKIYNIHLNLHVLHKLEKLAYYIHYTLRQKFVSFSYLQMYFQSQLQTRPTVHQKLVYLHNLAHNYCQSPNYPTHKK